jgi:Ketopantoate reductase
MTRYVIVGAGAVGAHLAAQFTLAGIDAVLIARGAQLDALRDAPLELRKAQGTQRVTVQVAADAAEARLTAADRIVFAVKSQDIENTVSQWAWQPLGDDSSGVVADLPALVLQNGVAAEDVARRRFRSVISIATVVPVNYLEPGVVIPYAGSGSGYFQVGALENAGAEDLALVDEVADDLSRAGYVVRVRQDISRRKHEKLLHNILNAVSVLDGEASDREALSAGLLAEAREVLRASGVDLDVPQDVDLGAALGPRAVEPTQERPVFRGSTWQNFAKGTPSEVDFLNGEIVLLGRRHGVPTPLNERVQRTLGRSSALGEAPGTHRISDILALANS